MRRRRILYLVPGHGLLSSVGPTRNVLNVANAMRDLADVTVAFRYVLDDQAPAGLPVIELDPERRPKTFVDDSAARGLGSSELISYLRRLRSFTATVAEDYDVILEKSWLFSGSLSALALQHGGLGVPVENVVPNAERHADAGMMKRLKVDAGRWLAGRSLRQAPRIIAETERLKRDMIEVWQIAPHKIDVVGLGIDRARFHPRERTASRSLLGIEQGPIALVYVGVLDETHALDAVLDAIMARPSLDLQLHVVGDGPRASVYRQKAGDDRRVRFHGRVPHDAVPDYIAAADLCLAPYDPRAFASGALGYSTMKVPEYLSVGRPVVSAPSERMRALLRDGEAGFMVDDTPAAWSLFLDALPDRAQLQAMGQKAAACDLPSWQDTARGYLEVCESALAHEQRSAG